MKKIILSISIIFFTLQLFAQKTSGTILTIDKEEVPVDEFIYVYEKNNNKEKNTYTKESLASSLDLFINYRLKVKEAESLGMDTVSSFIKEFEGYKKQLARPYLTEEGFEESMAKEGYERLKTDVSTSHILIKVEEFASPEDTLKAYNNAIEIRKQALSGKDFGQLAIEYSEDPSAANPKYKKGYKGFLGFNPAFSFVYPYETASYITKVGEISSPVRSKFGYHLIKVNEKRKSQGEVQVAHIMIDSKEGIDASDSINKRQIAFEVYELLKAGGNWNSLCKEHSADKRSSSDGGEMKPFKMDGKLGVPSFEKAAFELENIGDISTPVKTPYGWHILKLLKKIPLDSYETLKESLIKKVKRSDRSALNQDALIKRLKAENNFKEKKKIKTKLSKYADSTLLTGNWKIPSEYNHNKKVFKLNKDKFTYGDFFSYVQKNQSSNDKINSPSYVLSLAYDEFVNKTVYDYEEEHLAQKNDGYRLLLKEFRDGILFFDLMEDMVWNKAANDTSGIKKYYGEHKAEYKKPLETKAVIYKARDKETLLAIIEAIKSGDNDVQLQKKINESSALNLKIEKDTYEEGENEWIDKLDKNQKTHTITQEGNYMYIVIKEVIPAGIKELDKCKGLVISDYQKYVETEWIKSLKSKYQVDINEKTLNGLVK